MKKIVTASVALLSVITLAACSGKSASESSDKALSSVEKTSTSKKMCIRDRPCGLWFNRNAVNDPPGAVRRGTPNGWRFDRKAWIWELPK